MTHQENTLGQITAACCNDISHPRWPQPCVHKWRWQWWESSTDF